MEFRLIRSFLAVAEELHFTRAAERIGIAPPSLTVQIRLLEQQLGVMLFRRTKRRVELTRAGEALLPDARAMVDHAGRLERRAAEVARGEAGRIMLGYVGSAAFSGVLQAELARFRAISPRVTVEVREVPMQDMPALVEAGSLDVAFLRMPMSLPRALASRTLLEDHFRLALPEAHPLAARAGPVEATLLADCDFVLPEQEWGTLEAGRRGRFVPRVVARPGHLAAVATLVSLGVGVSVVPASLARLAMPAVRFAELAGPPIPSAVAAVFRRREPSAVVSRFVGMLCQREAGQGEADQG